MDGCICPTATGGRRFALELRASVRGEFEGSRRTLLALRRLERRLPPVLYMELRESHPLKS